VKKERKIAPKNRSTGISSGLVWKTNFFVMRDCKKDIITSNKAPKART